MIELPLQRTQAGFDVTQALAVGQLGERHCQILVPASEVSQSQVAMITLDATTKLSVRQKADQLRENRAALIHEPLSALLAFQIAASQK